MKRKNEKSYNLCELVSGDIKYPSGAVAYQGADDVFICLLSLSMVVQTVRKLPRKKQSPFLLWLSDRAASLMLRNSDFMSDLEELNKND